MGPKTLVFPSYFPYNISMKVWVYKAISFLLSALVLLASADVAFAGPKLPKKIKVTVPKTILPKTPTLPAVTHNVTAKVEQTVVAQVAATATATTVTPAKAPRARAPKKTPQQVIDTYKQWIEKYPNTSPKTDIKENGKSVSLTKLRERAQEGDEQAAKLAYELELGKAIDTALRNWSQDSHEYKELKNLYDANRNTKTPQQVIDAYNQWLIDHPNTSPRTGIRENGKRISLTELRKRARQGDEQATQLAYELELGNAIAQALRHWPKTFPKEYQELKALYDTNRNVAAPKTRQQVIDAFKQWLTVHPNSSPRHSIIENGKRLSLTELRNRARLGDGHAAKLADELELGIAIDTALQRWPQDENEYKELKTLYDANRNIAVPKTRQQVIDAYKRWIAEHPGTSPRMAAITVNGKRLSLTELRERARQGDKHAAKLADELELGIAISTALQNWSQDGNEYKELKALYDENRNTKTSEQLIAAYKQWITDHPGISPRVSIGESGESLSLTELRERARQGDEQAAQLAYELELGQAIHTALQTWPKKGNNYQELKALYDANRNKAAPKTPQQIIDAYKQWIAKHPNTSPRNTIIENGKFLTLTELRKRARQGDEQAAKLADELELGRSFRMALQNWSQDRHEYKELKALYDSNRNTRTRQQVIDAYKQWVENRPNTSPRTDIKENGKSIFVAELRKRAEQGDAQAQTLADELELGRAIGSALKRWPKNGNEYKEVKALYDENRNQAARKPTDELYQDLVAHIKDYKHYPTRNESSLYTNIYNRLRRHQSTMADGKYADPYLQKIYEIRQWAERVKRGEVDWQQFPGLFKKHRHTIGEMREQGILPSKEIAKELEQLPKEEQEAIEQMADNMLTLWEDFEGVWWKQNHKHVITTPQTQVAFNTVLNAVRHQVPGANNVNISNVLEQVNSMQLGQDVPSYYRVIYRGNNPRIPRAEDFHNVEEIAGVPQQYAQPAYKLNTPHISLDGDDEMVLNMFLTDGVTDKEMSSVIDVLTPAGWEVRIGAHELLNQIKDGKVHIHFEQIVPTTDEYATDTSYVLNVNLRALTRGKNSQQIAKTLRYLFSKYLKEDGHQALNNIGKAF